MERFNAPRSRPRTTSEGLPSFPSSTRKPIDITLGQFVRPRGPRATHSRYSRLWTNFSREPPFLLHRLSYMRQLLPNRADSPSERSGGVDCGEGELSENRDLTRDRRKARTGVSTGHGMVNRF